MSRVINFYKPRVSEREGMMKKISIKKFLIWGIIIVFLSAGINYGVTLILAHKVTPKIITEALNSQEIELCHKDLTQRQIDILLAVEDPNFFNHKGLDWKSPGAGRTTITQALVKQLYSTKFRPGLLNIKQNLIARFAFNSLSTKETQLKLFINNVYLGFWEGEPIYGFCEAARVYFKKEFIELSEDEYISLVAMIIGPDTFHVIKKPVANGDRVKSIKLLVKGGYKLTGHMDLYYGGKYFDDKRRGPVAKLVWGY
jgi:hypothetical protein